MREYDATSESRVRILVVDDHELVRHGTREILEAESGFEVVGEAADGEAAVRLAERLRPDLVLMDVAMPETSGAEATRRILDRCPGAHVVALTIHDDDEYVFEMLAAGASGYLLKDVRDQELVDAVRSVAVGEVVLQPSVTRRVLDRVRSDLGGVPSRGERLTERERQVLRLAATDRSNREIAEELEISPRTVEVHLGHVFRKLHVRTRTGAVMEGVRRGLVEVVAP